MQLFACLQMIYRLSLYLSLMHISTGFADQFDKYSYKTIDMNVGKNYDFLSIMHYDRRAFTKNGKETIVRIDNQAQEFGMPDLKSLSPMDILELNALYDCKSMCLLFSPIFGDCNSVKRACVTGGIIFARLGAEFWRGSRCHCRGFTLRSERRLESPPFSALLCSSSAKTLLPLTIPPATYAAMLNQRVWLTETSPCYKYLWVDKNKVEQIWKKRGLLLFFSSSSFFNSPAQ